MKKKILAGVLSAAMVAATSITAMNVFAADDKMVPYYEEVNWDTFRFSDPIEFDGEREIAWDQALSFDLDQVIDGEDSGASAKVWMVHSARERNATLFYIEVMDSDVVSSTDEQKASAPVAEEAFDSVSILVDSGRGGYKALEESEEYWLAEAGAGENGFIEGEPRWQSKQYINRIDATGYPAAHWPGGDYFGLGSESTNVDTSGVISGFYYEETDTGYILEFGLRNINFTSEEVNGFAFVLNDVDSEGNITRYAQNADIDPTDVTTFECFTNLSEVDDQILPSKISTDTDTDSDTGSDTSGDTGSDTSGDDPNPPVIDPSEIFTDVDKDAWYYNYVSYAYTHDLMKGTSDTTFEPGTTMTRAMFVRLFANLDGADLSQYTETKFEDVDMDSWYGTAVAWAEQNGVVNGTSETTFSPSDEITREQMCTLLVNYAEYAEIDLSGGIGQILADLLAAMGLEGDDIDLSELDALMDSITLDDMFPDAANVSDWAKEAVEICAKAGIINGKGDGSLDPQGTASRAEVATLITNFCVLYVDGAAE